MNRPPRTPYAQWEPSDLWLNANEAKGIRSGRRKARAWIAAAGAAVLIAFVVIGIAHASTKGIANFAHFQAAPSLIWLAY